MKFHSWNSKYLFFHRMAFNNIQGSREEDSKLQGKSLMLQDEPSMRMKVPMAPG
jgi:hypothetical protein